MCVSLLWQKQKQYQFHFLFDSCPLELPSLPHASGVKPQGLEQRSRVKMIFVLKIVSITALQQKLVGEEMEMGNLGRKKMETVK